MKDGTRAERVGDEIRQIIANALLFESRDERLREIEITAVRVAPDLGVARVFWLPVSPEPPSAEARKALQKALTGAAGFLRTKVGRELRARHVPELTFSYDESVDAGRSMERLLAGLEIPANEP